MMALYFLTRLFLVWSVVADTTFCVTHITRATDERVAYIENPIPEIPNCKINSSVVLARSTKRHHAQCGWQCLSDTACEGFNWHEDSKACELLESTDYAYLTADTGYTLYNSRDPKVETLSPCEQNPCHDGELCENACAPGGFNCRCEVELMYGPNCADRDGAWAAWNPYGSYTMLCRLTSYRSCTAPLPLGNGQMCVGQYLAGYDNFACRTQPIYPEDINYMGCYHVDAQYYFKTIDNNKESECKNACAGDDRIYFAMRGIFCACFNTLPFGSEVISLPETSCTVPCPGRVQETCGGISDSGTYPYSVFKTGAAYQGCYKVTDSSPEVTQSYPDGEDQKSAWCKTECENRKYMYGLVDAPYCTCVNVYQAMTVKVAESECEIGSGTGNQGGINGVKALMKTNFDPRGNDENFKLVDKKCYNPMSLTVGFLVSNRYAASCIKECSERGNSVAAAQMFSNNFLLCYCDRGIQSYAINKDWCTEECFDDKDCGGDSAHTLYQAVCRQAFGLGTTLAFTMEHRSKLYTRVGEEVPWAFNLEEDNTGIVSSTIGEILDPLETQPRFIVALGTHRLIRSIKYSGHPVEPTGVTGFKMAFSDDGVSYTFLYNTDTYDSKTIEPADMSKIGEGVIEEHLFADIIVTQYVQILVTAFKDFPTFRVELYGCVDTY